MEHQTAMGLNEEVPAGRRLDWGKDVGEIRWDIVRIC